MELKNVIVKAIGGLFLAMQIEAEGFSIDAHSGASGGGNSISGSFALSGTIGQLDSGPEMTGGRFRVQSGFWDVVAVVPTPGGPLLTIQKIGSYVVLSWESSAAEWTLQQNSQLTLSDWGPYTGLVSKDGSKRTVTYASASSPRFFRLVHP